MVLPVNVDLIPAEMKALNRWAVWKPEFNPDEGRTKKVSYYTQKRYASVSNVKTWLSFDSAVTLLDKYPEFEGLTFILTADLGITGVDYDDTITENGEFDNTKLEEIKALGSYVEISPSGQGIRAFCYARLPNNKGKNSRKYNIELYSDGKFLSVTGRHVESTPLTLNEAQEPINALYEKYFSYQNNTTDDSILPKTQISLPDKEIIQLLENGPYERQFRTLFYSGRLSN